MNILPVKLPDSVMGFVANEGLLRHEDENIVLEVNSKDNLFGIGLGFKTFNIASSLIVSATLEKKTFGFGSCSLKIQTSSLAPIADVPGMSMGKMSFLIDAKDEAAARIFVAGLNVPGFAEAKPEVAHSNLD